MNRYNWNCGNENIFINEAIFFLFEKSVGGFLGGIEAGSYKGMGFLAGIGTPDGSKNVRKLYLYHVHKIKKLGEMVHGKHGMKTTLKTP